MIKSLTNWSKFHINLLWCVEILKKKSDLKISDKSFQAKCGDSHL